jgi:hypothetical protein
VRIHRLSDAVLHDCIQVGTHAESESNHDGRAEYPGQSNGSDDCFRDGSCSIRCFLADMDRRVVSPANAIMTVSHVVHRLGIKECTLLSSALFAVVRERWEF